MSNIKSHFQIDAVTTVVLIELSKIRGYDLEMSFVLRRNNSHADASILYVVKNIFYWCDDS